VTQAECHICQETSMEVWSKTYNAKHELVGIKLTCTNCGCIKSFEKSEPYRPCNKHLRTWRAYK